MARSTSIYIVIAVIAASFIVLLLISSGNLSSSASNFSQESGTIIKVEEENSEVVIVPTASTNALREPPIIPISPKVIESIISSIPSPDTESIISKIPLTEPHVEYPISEPVVTKKVEIKTTPSPKIPGFVNLSQLIQCPKSVLRKYSSIDSETETSAKKEKQWCDKAYSTHKIIIGKSWGSLPKSDQRLWEQYHCNEHISVGVVLPCEHKLGWSFFEKWRKSADVIVDNDSNVTCYKETVRGSAYCEMKNVLLDFSKMKNSGSTRSFQEGFITIFGDVKTRNNYPNYLGTKFSGNFDSGMCDEFVSRNTYVVSNDDIYNLAHYMNDVIMTWALVAMDGVDGVKLDSQLMNVDGMKSLGPASGVRHRLMDPGAPDSHGPFSPSYYSKWFDQRVIKAQDFGNKRVCFDRVVMIPEPPVDWIWSDWWRDNDCSHQGPSPLYQSFNYYLRKHFARHLKNNEQLEGPPTDYINIVVEVRTNGKVNSRASARIIRNLSEMIAELKTIPGVQVTNQDFAALPFPEQIKLAHRTSILVSMHGAGNQHIFHMAAGQKNCCGLLELFPDDTNEFMYIHGVSNTARHLGMHNARYVPPHGSTTGQGTMIDVKEVKKLTAMLVEKVKLQPTCLNDVRDV